MSGNHMQGRSQKKIEGVEFWGVSIEFWPYYYAFLVYCDMNGFISRGSSPETPQIGS